MTDESDDALVSQVRLHAKERHDLELEQILEMAHEL